jgi:hypothetical protein
MFVFVDGLTAVQSAYKVQDILYLTHYYPYGYIVESDLGLAYKPPAPIEDQPVVSGAQTL